MKTYTITVTERQLRLISEACDTAGRIYRGIPETVLLFDNVLLGQYRGNGYPDALHYKRQLLANCLKQLRLILNEPNRTDKTEEEHILHDIHQVVRNKFYQEREDKSWGVDASVTKTGNEPLIKIS